jgi:hypothetical protein
MDKSRTKRKSKSLQRDPQRAASGEKAKEFSGPPATLKNAQRPARRRRYEMQRNGGTTPARGQRYKMR